MGTWNPKANDLFLKAIAIDSHEERQEFLKQAANGDSELCQEVNSLLSSHDDAGSFLLEPVAEFEATENHQQIEHEAPLDLGRPRSRRPAPASGKMIDNYKLLQQIGEGGFGVVYMAEQLKPVRRKVAVKVIKPGMDSREIIARLESERQALALMDHPNIARVLDAGTTELGNPYFVMELVKGIPLTKFCDENNLATRDRLELFVTICRAVHHAHQKGIIHRDIKPANVMVTLHDGKPVPKVIDFGVSKALNQQLTEKTLFTRYGQMVGTPQYMSPEQAEMSGLDIDTRSDIYSLGVLLYELLTGSTPLDADFLRNSGYAEMQRIIREQEPPKPSTRLSTLGESLPRIAETHRTDESRLQQLVKGELDWITMKALEKERTRRYDSASSFADDVERFLNNEAVAACPPSTVYLLRKFARRNKGPVIAALTVVTVLVLGIIGTSTGFFHADFQRRKADRLATTNLEIAHKAEGLAREEASLRKEAQRISKIATTRARELDEALYLHRIKLAHEHLLSNRPVDARRLLVECPEQLRDWEWNYLIRRCHIEPSAPIKFAGRVYSIEFGPRHEQILAGLHDGTGMLTDSADGKTTTFNASKRLANDPLRWTTLSPDGTLVAAASENGSILLINVSTGEVVRKLAGHHGAVNCVHFSSDSKRLASGSNDGTVKIWDAASGNELQTFNGGSGWIWSVAFSTDSRLIATGAVDGEVAVWKVADAQQVFRQIDHFAPVISVAFNDEGTKVASASFDNSIKVWDSAMGEQTPLGLKGHTHAVNSAVFNPSGTRIVSSSLDGSVRIWDAFSGEEILTLQDSEEGMNCAKFSRDGQKLIAAGESKQAWILDATRWEDASEPQSVVFSGFQSRVHALSISPDGKRLAAGGEDGHVKIWDLTNNSFVDTFDNHAGSGVANVFDLSFGLHGRYIFSVGGDPDSDGILSMQCWDSTSKDGSSIFSIPIGQDDIGFCLALSPDGESLVAGGKGKQIKVFDARTGELRNHVLGSHDRAIGQLAFDPKGKYLVSVGLDREVKRWDATRLDENQSGTKLFDGKGVWFGTPGFSPNGREIVVMDGKTAVVLDLETGEISRTFSGHGDTVNCARFSPNGEYLASGSTDGTVRLWNAETGQHIKTLLAKGAIYRLEFTPDGRRLAAASEDTTVRLWDVGSLYDAAE